MTKNKVLGLFIFLNLIAKILFSANLVLKLQSALLKMKLDAKKYSRLLILNQTILFLNSVPKMLFWVNEALKLQSALFRMKIFWVSLVQQLQSVSFKMKLDTKGYPRLVILSSRKVFTNSVSTIPFLGIFGRKTLECFVQNETRYKGVVRDADSELDNCFLKFCP